MSVDLDESDQRAINALGSVSIICKNTSEAYMKNINQSLNTIIPCDELRGLIRREGKEPIEHHLPTIQETIEAPTVNNAEHVPVAATNTTQA